MLEEVMARDLHEASRAAVEAGKVVNRSPGRFLEWHEITDDAREGRRIQARWLQDNDYGVPVARVRAALAQEGAKL